MPPSVAILGPGLLGASIALALRERHPATEVRLWGRRPAVVEELRARQVAAVVSTDLRETVCGAQIIVLCTPIGVMTELAQEIAPLLGQDALVTDVGSVKAPVIRQLSPIFAGKARFVGSHPMAGSEKTGHEAASPTLFEGRVCIVTPDNTTDERVMRDVGAFWSGLGANVRMLSPEAHDETVAWISHLPHLLAATLMQTVDDANDAAFAFHGPGFFDTTRVASGAPAMWAEILCTNRVAVRASVEAMIEKLRDFTTLLDRQTPMHEYLTQAKALRDRLRPTN